VTSAKLRRRGVKKEEEYLARTLGGRRTFNSGAGDEKGDGRVAHTYQIVDGAPFERSEDAFRIESKTTASEGYRLAAVEWEKLQSAALRQSETPVFVIRLGTATGPMLRLAVVPTRYATGLLKVTPHYEARATKGHRLTSNRWNQVTATPGTPHLRLLLEGTSRQHDLVVISWAYFVQQTESRKS
jgi:hypothetical protein